MIRVAAQQSPPEAVADLTRAFDLDPTALGDEPETLQAAVFLVNKTLQAGDRARAQRYFSALGELKTMAGDQPLKTMAAFSALRESVAPSQTGE